MIKLQNIKSSNVTESLFWGRQRGGADLHRGGGGGQREASHVLCTIKSQMGGQWGGVMVRMGGGGHGPTRPPPL